MRPNCCHFSLAFLLKLVNFLQAFVGVSILLYSIWMLNQWDHNIPQPQPPLLPHLSISLPRSLSFHFTSSFNLPAPWFIYAFMCVGILVCCIAFFGCIAAEIFNGCCLCFYTLLVTVLVLLEAALVIFIAIDRRWQKDLPADPTGQLESLRSFIETNQDICRWVGIAVLVIQALSLLLALILRATVSSRRADLDEEEEEYAVRGRSWEPLLNHQAGQTSGSSKGDIRGNHADVWSSRMREKYGLNNGDKHSYEA